MNLGPDAINALLWLLHQAQQAGWQWLDAWGLTQPLHGQPGWPFAHRLAAEYLLTEPGQSRRLLLALASLLLLALLGALAWRCGFADPSAFSKLFRARFGLSPTEWRLHARGSLAD